MRSRDFVLAKNSNNALDYIRFNVTFNDVCRFNPEDIEIVWEKSVPGFGERKSLISRVAERVKASFYDDPDHMIWVQPPPGHIVASLDKTHYDDYLCLVASNKQQISWTKIRENPQEHWITKNS